MKTKRIAYMTLSEIDEAELQVSLNAAHDSSDVPTFVSALISHGKELIAVVNGSWQVPDDDE